ncbi:MAG TPA: hypothetical protein VJQ08_04105 [Candidatus Dormibacteraeota bacterium]|nr:hypothetical protein [Candidatus Dormibacteraeota bacterium]
MPESPSTESVQSGGPWRVLAATLAVLVTLGIVAGLVFYRLSSRSSGPENVGKATVNGIGLKCRLPVVAGAAAGFIGFPDGTVAIDHSVGINPYKGGFSFTYDAGASRWVPVFPSALSPDGRSYAYVAQTTGVPGVATSLSLHTHEVVSGRDHLLWEGTGSLLGGSVTWLPSGIYFTAVLTPDPASLGQAFPTLYVADPNHAGTPRRVGPNPAPQPATSKDQFAYGGPDIYNFVGGGAAWGLGMRTPQVLPAPDASPIKGPFGPDHILRMDLRDGSVSTWYTASGNDIVSIVALDAQGQPILSLFSPKTPPVESSNVYEPPPPRLMLLTGPNQTAAITSGNADFHFGGMVLADSHGIWFGGWNDVWVYTSSAGLRKAVSVPAGVFPSPSPPPGFPAKPGVIPSGKPGMPAYMQGTLINPAGPCT